MTLFLRLMINYPLTRFWHAISKTVDNVLANTAT